MLGRNTRKVFPHEQNNARQFRFDAPRGPALCAQTFPPANAAFVYNDNGLGGGNASSGTYTPGQSIVFNIFLHFAAPPPTDASGISYFLAARQGVTGTGASAPGIFAITSREVTTETNTSPWTARNSLGPIFPQQINGASGNDRDLGAVGDTVVPSSKDIFVARLTISIAANAALGFYTLQNVIAGESSGHVTTINDSDSNSYALPRSLYTVTIVPEPTVSALLLVSGAIGTVAFRRVRCRKLRH